MNGRRLLVVDDDVGIRDVVRAYAEREGFVVSEAAAGDDAARLRRILGRVGDLEHGRPVAINQERLVALAVDRCSDSLHAEQLARDSGGLFPAEGGRRWVRTRSITLTMGNVSACRSGPIR